jgi:hypothetical protein
MGIAMLDHPTLLKAEKFSDFPSCCFTGSNSEAFDLSCRRIPAPDNTAVTSSDKFRLAEERVR